MRFTDAPSDAPARNGVNCLRPGDAGSMSLLRTSRPRDGALGQFYHL